MDVTEKNGLAGYILLADMTLCLISLKTIVKTVSIDLIEENNDQPMATILNCETQFSNTS